MRLVLIRHGETAHNADGVTLGRADVPLNERGTEQAQSLATLASAWHVLDAPISMVYASPLERARATAAPLARALGIEVRPEPRLIEMDVGDTEGISYARVREQHPEFLRRWLSEDVADARMPGGETLREVQERAWAAIAEMSDRHAAESVVAVTHNFVILALLCRVLNLPLATFRSVRQDLAAVSVIDIVADGSRVITLNDRCHLRDAMPQRRE